jgi:hypothetical protein
MQKTWRGCLPIIGYFAELQERNAMTQTSEPGIKSRHSEDDWARGDGAQTTTAERPAISDKSEHLQFADLETNSDFGFFHSAGNSVPASRLATAPGSSARWNRLRIDRIVGTATAFLFAGLAPALVMAALWHTAEVVPLVFIFTFAIALAHAVLLGLPLFLVFRRRGWINITTCVVFGFAVGAVPDGIMTWPIQHAALYASESVDGVPTIINGVITAAEWVSYVKPVIYCGSYGALGGLAFWVVLIWSGSSGKAAAAVDRSQACRV